MCGIVGIAAAADAAPPAAEAVERAVAALRHRGPDGSGVHLDDRVALGHTRLSIIDVEGGAQPLANEDGSVWTVFNGEIWNHERLRSELETAGHRFRTRCDTEVLVHGWEEWGEGLLKRIDGMFAFAVWDGRTRQLVLARDRAGKKPLYVAETEHGVAFGSDARAVAIVSGREPAVDPEAVAAHLFQRYTVSPRTLFLGIERLEPGQLLIYDGSDVERRPYWTLDPGAEESLAPGDLRELLREAVRAHLMSDVPIGILLSGGVDSSAVLGLAREVGAEGIDTFTIGFADSVYDERELARLAAKRHGARHHEVVVDSSSFLEALPRLAWFRDEPIAEPSEIPLLLLAEFAGSHVKVALGGDGGDEVFGGYPKYRAERVLRLGKIVPQLTGAH
jgi:asparagine synthase (glutamine-hydrolysing)